jgi:hypothetical protein
MGNTLKDMPDISWKYVKEEKAPDMIHVLEFPYNGEPPRVSKPCMHMWLLANQCIGPTGSGGYFAIYRPPHTNNV